jgi:hypothetical protein
MSNKDQDKGTIKDPFADIDFMDLKDINFGEWESFGFDENLTKSTKSNTKKDPLDNHPLTDWSKFDNPTNPTKTDTKKDQ